MLGSKRRVLDRQRPVVELLEPRVLYSADLSPAALAGGALLGPAEVRLLDHAVETHAVEVAFVDTATPDYRALVDDITRQAGPGRDIDVILLDGESDGIEQITDALSGRSDISAVHIISHGTDGAVQLGAGTLDAQTLHTQQALIASWGDALTADADLLFYGCDVAATAEGRALMGALGGLTGADVAASTDSTGHAALGGDWDLEYRIGLIEVHLALSQDAQEEWFALLDVASLQASQDTYIVSSTSNNYGASTQLILDKSGGSLGNQRLLVQFDLSAIPVGATINSAFLEMQATAVTNSMAVEVHELLAAWDEGTGNGTADAANWIQRITGTNWGSAGGSFNASAAATVNAIAGVPGQHSWNISSLVQAWFAGAANNGVIVGSSDGGGGTVTYDSREQGANAPRLVIDYSLDTVLTSYAPPFTSLGDQVYEVKAGLSWGQTFAYDSPSPTYAVDKVGLVLYRAVDATPGQTVTVSLRSAWNGAVIASGTVSGDSLGTGEAWVNVVLSGTATLSDNATYVIRVDSSGTDKIYVGVHDAGTYADGTLLNSGGVAEPAKDMAFRIIDTLNRAPVLAPAAPTLTTITEDQTGNAGQTVASIVGASISDADAGAAQGIAINALSSGNGTWEYSINGGGSWSAIGVVNDASALLLRPNDLMRFEPDTLNATSASITYRAWDQTSGAAGVKVNAGTNGGITAFSSATDTASLAVTAVNDAPTLNAPAAIAVTEDLASVLTGIFVGDVDSGGADVVASFTVAQGTLAAASGGGVTVGGSATALTLTGSIANINTYIGAFGLSYTTALDDTSAVTLAVSVNDGGNTGSGGALSSGVSNVMLNVSPVNDAPEHTVPAAQNTPMNTAVTFSTGNANAISVSDVDIGANPVEMTLSVSNGTLTLSGTLGLTFSVGSGTGDALMTFSGTTAAINAALEGLNYDPTLGFSGSDSLNVTTNDLGSSGVGGPEIVNNTVVINVAFVNSAPVLSGANDLGPINEDPATNLGTLVSALITAPVQVSDADAGALSGIAVTAVDNTNGSWQYSIDGGGSWLAFGSPSATTARLLATDANTFVRFAPNANFNGTVTNGLTFRAWDRTSGAAGGTSDTATPIADTVRDNFGAASYTNDDGSAFWATGWVDVDGNPAAGNIQIAGGQLVLAANLSTDSIFREANLSGATSATLSFSYDNRLFLGVGGSITLEASSNGGGSYSLLATFSPGSNSGVGVFSTDITAYAAANTRIRFSIGGISIPSQSLFVDDLLIAYVTPASGGSTAFSAATASATITVDPVNDAPVGTANTVTVLEEGSHVFSAAEFGFIDPNDIPANGLLAVQITTLPGAGSLTNNGVAVTAGQFVSAADIGAGFLVFAPAANANGPGYASFTFQVQDDGGGSNLDTTARTMTIDVTAVNDAPAGANNTVSVLEDGTHVFSTAEFGFTDPNDTPANGLLAVQITTLPGAGSLTISGIAVTAGQFVSAANIGGGLLVFAPAADANGLGYASFTFQVQDDGGGSNLDTTARTMTIDVTAVNDAPVGADNTVAVLEDGSHVFSAAEFGFTDPNDIPADSLLAVRIITPPGAGTLTNNGVAVTAGQFVSAADIGGGLLVFAPAADANGPGYASFTFQVQDDGGGSNLDTTARTMTVDVTAVNDAPAGVPAITGTVTEDQLLTADTSGIGDADGLGAFSYQWLRNGAPIATATASTYTLGDADVGTQISAQVSYLDAQGTNEGPLTSAQTAPVANVNDAPVGVPAITGTVTEDQVLTADTSGISDADGLGAFSYQWLRNGVPIATATASTYTLGDADVGTLISVQVSYTDVQGTLEGPLTSVQTAAVANVNDAPVGAAITITMLQDGAHVFSASDFGFSDPNDSPANALLAVRIATVPTAGALTNNGTTVTAGQFVSAAEIGAGLLVFAPASGESGAGYASFTFQVQDDGGGSDLDGIARTLTFNVVAPAVIVLPPSPDPIVPPPPRDPLPPLTVPPPAPADEASPTPAATAPRAAGSGDLFAFEVAVSEGTILPPLVSREFARDAIFTVGLRTFSPGSLPGEGIAEAVTEIRLGDRVLQLAQLEDVLSSASRPQSLAEEINSLRETLSEQAQLQQVTVGALAVGGLSLTVGYVLWIVRGGVLAASLLSTLPAWRFLDPLPILAQDDDEDEDADDSEDADDVAFQAFLEEGAR